MPTTPPRTRPILRMGARAAVVAGLRPVYRITIGDRTYFPRRVDAPTAVVTGSVPGIRAESTGQAFAVIPPAQFRPGPHEVTVCVDIADTVFEMSETNNCSTEYRTL